MGEINYQICLAILDNLVAAALVTDRERVRIITLLKEEFSPTISLMTG